MDVTKHSVFVFISLGVRDKHFVLLGQALLEFEVGSGRVIKAFDMAVRGLSIGESRTVISPLSPSLSHLFLHRDLSRAVLQSSDASPSTRSFF
jgi:hypothetical protein